MSSMNLYISAIVICSTWLLGSGTLPTRMSRAVSMRRLVSVSSTRSPSGSELVQGDVVLDILGHERAIPLRNGLEVDSRQNGVGCQVGEPPAFDDVAHQA